MNLIFLSILYFYVCIDGFPSKNLTITGGNPAKIEDYPYQVSLVYIDQHICGGSLLTQQHVLTATHCTVQVPNKQELLVRAGSSIVNEGGELNRVIYVYEHEKFKSTSYDYDVAILELETLFVLSSTIKVIQISKNLILEGTVAVATGWGRLSENGRVPMQLQEVSLPTLSFETCELVYGSEITERMICAGYPQGEKDTCQGDSGGPLAVNGIVIGITSWGDGCGKPNSPGIYTNVSAFTLFIDGIINN